MADHEFLTFPPGKEIWRRGMSAKLHSSTQEPRQMIDHTPRTPESGTHPIKAKTRIAGTDSALDRLNAMLESERKREIRAAGKNRRSLTTGKPVKRTTLPRSVKSPIKPRAKAPKGKKLAEFDRNFNNHQRGERYNPSGR